MANDSLFSRFFNLIEDARWDGIGTDEIRSEFERALGVELPAPKHAYKPLTQEQTEDVLSRMGLI